MIEPTDSFVEFPLEDAERSVPWRFERQAEKHGERLAVKCGEVEITYDAFNRTANRIARAILAEDGEGEGQVCTVFGHDVMNIAAIMAALKAGKAFVPLDPSYPYERTKYMVADCQARTVVTDSNNLELAERLGEGSRRIVNVDSLDERLADDDLGFEVSPRTRSHILYTSGSTGNPKGVIHVQRDVLNFVRGNTNSQYVTVEDRMTHMMSTSFGASLSCYFTPLLNGASVHIFDPKVHSPEELADWLIRDGITFFYAVPSLFRAVASVLRPEMDFTKLRLIRLAGEAVTPADVDLYQRRFPGNAVFTNVYGSTEAMAVTQHFIEKGAENGAGTVPVGYEYANAEVLILDDDFNELGPGEIGQVAVRSRYLALGYCGRPDLTEKVFLPDGNGSDKRVYLTGDMGRLDALRCLEVLGRKDFQVKVRGYRVETSEIEMSLLRQDAIKEAAVIAREDISGDTKLVAYIVAAGSARPPVSELRDGLSRNLPEYMVPSSFVFLECLPLTPNGKLDRRALPAPTRMRAEMDMPFVAARTPVEERLAEVWADVLRLDKVGVDDSFLDLGGHSLLAGQVISRVLKTFRINIPLASLFEKPTVARMAVAVTEGLAARAHPEELERMLDDVESCCDEGGSGGNGERADL